MVGRPHQYTCQFPVTSYLQTYSLRLKVWELIYDSTVIPELLITFDISKMRVTTQCNTSTETKIKISSY